MYELSQVFDCFCTGAYSASHLLSRPHGSSISRSCR